MHVAIPVAFCTCVDDAEVGNDDGETALAENIADEHAEDNTEDTPAEGNAENIPANRGVDTNDFKYDSLCIS